MITKLDCCNLPCPEPVLKTKDFIDKHGTENDLIVLINDQAALLNITRFVESQGHSVSAINFVDNHYEMVIKTINQKVNEQEDVEPDKKILIMITNEVIGSGDNILGSGLMLSFLKTLDEIDNLWRIIFINSGVKLTTVNTETVKAIQKLEKRGVAILVCGTCLTSYGLLNINAVGEPTNMLDVVTSMQVADKIISI